MGQKRFILFLSLLAGAAAGNPILDYDYYMSEFSSDPDTVQWLEFGPKMQFLIVNDLVVTTSTSACTLNFYTEDPFFIVDSLALNHGGIGRGTFRLNPDSDFIALSWLGDEPFERVWYPARVSCSDSSSAPPAHCSACRWEPLDGFRDSPSIWYIDSTPTPGRPNNDCSVIRGSLRGVPFNWAGLVRVWATSRDCRSAVRYSTAQGYGVGVMPGKYRIEASGDVGDQHFDTVYPESVEVGYSAVRDGIDFEILGDTWITDENFPKHGWKGVRAGGALTGGEMGLFALRGGATTDLLYLGRVHEFPQTWQWYKCEPIPLAGRTGEARPVGRGGALAIGGDYRVYVAKGHSTLEFWAFVYGYGDPDSWVQLQDIPAGGKTVGAGAGMAALTVGESARVYLMKGSGTTEFYCFDVATGQWRTSASLPSASSDRHYPGGSALCSDGQNRLFALEGGVNAFFSYDASRDAWTRLPDLPLIGRSGRERRVGPGGALTFWGGNVYALKGGSTLEFWRYDTASKVWIQGDDLPRNCGRPRRGVGWGGSLTAVGGRVFALKGNNTGVFLSHDVSGDSAHGLATLETGLGANRLSWRSPFLKVQPNPFRGRALVSYQVPGQARVRLEVADAAGRIVRTLTDPSPSVGERSVTWDGRDEHSRAVAPGVYFLRLHCAGQAMVQKAVVTE